MPALNTSTRFNALGLILAALAGTTLSLVLTGFVFGVSNNIFHLGIMAELYDLPQFHDDAFNQSLRHFASGFWLLFRGTANDLDPAITFAILHFASRFLCFIGFLLAASLLGITSLTERLIFSVLLAAATMMRGFSSAGDGGLFYNYFTHSEIANGLTLLVVYFCVRAQLHYAVAVNGLVFFINAFIAFWNMFPIVAFLIYRLRAHLSSRKEFLRLSLGSLVFLLLAAPVLMMVLRNPDAIQGSETAYVDFLRYYYPQHFFWDANGLRANAALALITTLGFLSFQYSGDEGRKFQLALLSFCFVYVIGIIIPSLTDSRLLLNLHLLRSSTNIQLLATLGLICLATRWLTSESATDRLLFGPVLATVMCLPKSFLPIALIGLIVRPFAGGLKFENFWIRRAAAAVVLLYTGFIGWSAMAENRQLNAAIGEWRTVALWANVNTDVNAAFLLPVVDPNDEKVNADPAKGAGSETFEYYSKRSSWVDFKRGAAAMWSPSYLPEWRQRIAETTALHSVAAMRDYARRHDIQYIICDCTKADTDAVFRTQHLCVLAASGRTTSQHSSTRRRLANWPVANPSVTHP